MNSAGAWISHICCKSIIMDTLLLLATLLTPSWASTELGLHIQDILLTNLDDVTQKQLLVDPHQSRDLNLRPRPTTRFLADENVEDYANSLACGFCKQNLTVGDEGIIESPNYPDAYTANVNCLWLLETADLDDRIVLHCDTIELESCGTNEGTAPEWQDYLVISPLWNFKKSWLYCGHATSVKQVKHTSLCHKMAVSFRSNNNHNCNKGFHCSYQII